MKKTFCSCAFLLLILTACQNPASRAGNSETASDDAGVQVTAPGDGAEETASGGGAEEAAGDDDGGDPSDAGDGGDSGSGKPADPVPVPEKPIVKSLKIVSFPKKCGYEAGEIFDLTGLSVSVAWSDGTATTPDIGSLTVSGGDTSKPGAVPVSVSYGDASASFGLYVIPADYFVTLAGGPFTMGSDLDRDMDNPAHAVSLSPFRVARFELTYALWAAVRDWAAANQKSGFTFAGRGREGNDGTGGAPPSGEGTEPVTYMSWVEAAAWCNAFAEMFGLSPLYFTDAACSSVLRATDWAGSVFVRAGTDGFRLPTEAEWEFAAGRTVWAGTDDEAKLPDYAWSSKNAQDSAGKGSTWPVGRKLPNESGLCDMSGNVAEWCGDLYDSGWYASSPPADPAGPAAVPAGGSFARVIRGGSYSSALKDLRVATRKSLTPSSRSGAVGFRLVRTSVVR